MPELFDPFTLRGVTPRNRFGLPPSYDYVIRPGCGAERPESWTSAESV